MDTTDKCFLPPRVRRNPPCLTVPQTNASLQGKQLRKGLLCGLRLLVARLGAVTIWPPLSASVRGCAPSLPDTTELFGLRSPLVLVAPSTCGGAGRLSKCVRGSPSRLDLMPLPWRVRAVPADLFVDPIQFTWRCCVFVDALWSMHSQFGTGGSSVSKNVRTKKPRNADQFAAIACNS